MCAVWRTYRQNATVLLVRFESPPTQHDAGDLRPSYASNRVLAATIWFNGTRTVQTANANTGVGSGLRPLYGSNSGHFMVQVTANTVLTTQDLEIRNGGASFLDWTAAVSTADGGNWLSISAPGGTAPSHVTVSISVANLPNGGLAAGVFIGELVFQSAGGNASVPVTVVVGDSILRQVTAISFSKLFGGANPLPQTLTITSTGATNIGFTVTSSTATGGAWLSVSRAAGCTNTSVPVCTTPHEITAAVVADASLDAGTYTGQIVLTSSTGSMSITVPVTLTVAPSNEPFFDNLPGQLSFSIKTGRLTSTSQDLQVRNGGTGSLHWALSASTSDGADWLTISATSGAAPSRVTVGVTVADLPGGGLVAGSFTGELVFRATGGSITVPVSVVVGDSILSQINAISFTKPFGGANPLPQILTMVSTGDANVQFTVSSATGTGGAWLSVSRAAGCTNTSVPVCTTPHEITASVVAVASLAAGTYTGQIVLTSSTGSQSVTVPVTLTVAPSNEPFFDNLPGLMSFSIKTGRTTSTSQKIQIRNAGSGTLSWAVTKSTADGGDWITISPQSATAPSLVTVGVSVANLPGGGALAGSFIGELVFRSAASSVTVPVSVVVGDSILSQVNPISFAKPFGGANPLPQILTIASTGAANIQFTVTSSTGTGGAWLSVSRAPGCTNTSPPVCTTPHEITASVVAGPTLAAGTYTGQIVIISSGGSQAITVPVTLTVAGGGAFFDNTPGQLTFSLVTGGSNPPSQTVQIRDAGSQTLNWTLASSTSDGGAWLRPAGASGTATSTLTISINAANLPGGGAIAGAFTGMLLFQSAGGSVTIPVSVTVGDPVLVQPGGLSFAKTFGGVNPDPQTLNISSSGAAIDFTVISQTGTGGAWLSISRGAGCTNTSPPVCTTPHTVTVTIVAGQTLAVGTYTGQVIATSKNGSMDMTVPVTLQVGGAAQNPTGYHP